MDLNIIYKGKGNYNNKANNILIKTFHSLNIKINLYKEKDVILLDVVKIKYFEFRNELFI